MDAKRREMKLERREERQRQKPTRTSRVKVERREERQRQNPNPNPNPNTDKESERGNTIDKKTEKRQGQKHRKGEKKSTSVRSDKRQTPPSSQLHSQHV